MDGIVSLRLPVDKRIYGNVFDEELSFFKKSCIIKINIFDNTFQLKEASEFMGKEITLDIAAEQQEMKITGVTGSQAQKTRMLQMGFTPGTRVRIVRSAPMADPLEIKVRGTRMLLRRDECRKIRVASAE